MDLTIVEFHSQDRDYLEAKGWQYAGSNSASAGGPQVVYSHYWKKGEVELPTRQAVSLEAGSGARVRYPIPPEIQALNVTRQRKLQLSWKLAGVCVRCGGTKADGSKSYCLSHLIKARERSRGIQKSTRRNYKAISYVAAGWED